MRDGNIQHEAFRDHEPKLPSLWLEWVLLGVVFAVALFLTVVL